MELPCVERSEQLGRWVARSIKGLFVHIKSAMSVGNAT